MQENICNTSSYRILVCHRITLQKQLVKRRFSFVLTDWPIAGKNSIFDNIYIQYLYWYPSMKESALKK